MTHQCLVGCCCLLSLLLVLACSSDRDDHSRRLRSATMVAFPRILKYWTYVAAGMPDKVKDCVQIHAINGL